MRILVASDSFKGSLTSPELAALVTRGLHESGHWPNAEVISLPISDGGDGVAEAIHLASGGTWHEVPTTDVLGREQTSRLLWQEETHTAIVEMAEASGIIQIAPSERDPWRASTAGTGRLIEEALQLGAKRILLGLGGSATDDGGTGMAQQLGVSFVNEAGAEQIMPEQLPDVRAIEGLEVLHQRLAGVEVIAACDVENPLLGDSGCSAVYGPQKGLQPSALLRHQTRLTHLVDLLGAQDVASLPGSGAAGGMGFAARVFLNATLQPGFDVIADILALEQSFAIADLVITGEGMMDAQSREGKAPYRVAQMAKDRGIPCASFCGKLGDTSLIDEMGPIFEIAHPDWSLAENMARAAERYQATVEFNAAFLRQLAEAGRRGV